MVFLVQVGLCIVFILKTSFFSHGNKCCVYRLLENDTFEVFLIFGSLRAFSSSLGSISSVFLFGDSVIGESVINKITLTNL